jgi:predicted HTH domain antitoxin
MGKVITAQVEDTMAEELEEFMKVYGADRSTAIRKLLERGMGEWKVERAVTKYGDGEISVMRAAEMAGISIWEFLEILEKRELSVHVLGIGEAPLEI